jgi:glycosyltransferase involved in cell wall biosynthesis
VNTIRVQGADASSSRRLSILLVIDHLGAGGAQRQLVNVGVHLHLLGHHVDFFTYYPARELAGPVQAAGLRVIESPKSSRYALEVPLNLRRQLIAGGYDVALSYLDTPNLYLELAAAGVRTKVVVSQRAQYPQGKLSLVKRMLENFHRLADHVVVNSQCQRARMVEEFPWLAERISTIVNGVDDTFFQRARVSRSSGPCRFLAAATVVPLKNADGLIEAAAICRQAQADIHVTWAGRFGDDTYSARLQRRIDELGLGDRWRWLGQCGNVADLMHSADALVHPSHSEGFPNAICEAMATGMPVLASRVGDHEFLVGGARAGYLFDSARPDDIAAAMLRLIGLPSSEFEELGRNARRFASEHLSIELCARRYEDLFLRLVGGGIA